VLVFCSGVDHASHVTETLAEITGERIECVTGETPQLIREGILEGFTSGDFRFCVNVDVLTTGFDNPRIDCVAIMRATQSAGLFCQMVGRGLRTHPSKQDALIIDFGGNLRRHGPIDAIDFASKKKSESTGDAPEKKCPACGEMVPAGTRVCECGLEFIFNKAQHDAEPDTESQILSEPIEFEVREWVFNRHVKRNAPDAPNTLRVTYIMPGNLVPAIDEWVCLNHEGFAFKKAMRWWSDHTDEHFEDVLDMLQCDGVEAALELEKRGYMRMPTKVTAVQEGKFWRITDRVRGELRPKTEEEEIPF
jgi:DNA repair protein RadD